MKTIAQSLYLLTSYLIFADTNYAKSEEAPLFVSKKPLQNRYIVILKQTANTQDLRETKNSLSLSKNEEIHHTFSGVKGFAATLNPETVKKLRSNPKVNYIEQDSRMQVFQSQCDNQRNSGWCLQRVSNVKNPSNTYRFGSSWGNGVTVYVIDTGVNINHPDLKGRAFQGTNVVNETADDFYGHGTGVASIVAGKTAGVAKKAIISAVKVLDKSGSGTTSDVVMGIDWAAGRCKETKGIINLSLGGSLSQATNDATDNAHNAGCLVVVAAGNSEEDACDVSPASAKNAFTVGASEENNRFASFSNRGKCVKVIAPGVKCKMANAASNGFVDGTGTSFASPIVAGIAASMKSQNPSLTNKQLAEMILQQSKPEITRVPRDTTNKIARINCV